MFWNKLVSKGKIVGKDSRTKRFKDGKKLKK